MKEGADESVDEKSRMPTEVTINPDSRKIRQQNLSLYSASGTMVPKPAIFESDNVKARDEHHLISDEAEYAGKHKYAGFHDDASEAGDNSVASYSGYSSTDTEREELDSSRRERKSRRSSSRRRKSRSRSSASRRGSKSTAKNSDGNKEDKKVPRDEQSPPVHEIAPPQMSSTTSHLFQGKQEGESVFAATKNGKAGDQPLVKLINFNALYRAEQDRAPWYAEELAKVTSNWIAGKTVLQRLLDEVKHANHLFHVSDLSFHQYSHVMYTIHKDIFLDDQGQRVLSSARQQLLLKQRGAVNSDSSGRDEHTGTKDSYLDPLYNSFSVLSDTMMKTVLDRESDNGKQVATIEFQEFCEEFISQAEAMKAVGDSVVQEMKGSEKDIQSAFQVLQHLAAKAKTSKSSSVLDADIELGKPNKNFPKEMGYGGGIVNAGDWWLWETLYRAAAKHQQVTWDANQERMEGLEESLQYFQEKHQQKLEKAVLAVMPEQREMFLVGAKAFESALKKTDAFSDKIAGKARFDHEQIAHEFEQGVQKRSATILQTKAGHKSAILNRSRSKYNSAIEQAESMAASSGDLAVKPLQAFGSPVLSKLVLETRVLERWEKSGWLTTVAVFTADRFLHLFDCSDLNTKTLPQTAFASMFPTSAQTRSNVHHRGGGRKKANRVTESKIPSPSMTFNIVTCTLKTYGYARRSFEIKQVEDPTAKSKDLPHTTLRFKDNQEAAHWYALLQDLPDPNQGKVNQKATTNKIDEKKIQAEALRQQHLYDDLEDEADRDLVKPDGNDDEGVGDFSDGKEETKKKSDRGDYGFQDAIEEEGEFEVTVSASKMAMGAEVTNGEDVVKKIECMEEVNLQTVSEDDDDDDDSFHST